MIVRLLWFACAIVAASVGVATLTHWLRLPWYVSLVVGFGVGLFMGVLGMRGLLDYVERNR